MRHAGRRDATPTPISPNGGAARRSLAATIWRRRRTRRSPAWRTSMAGIGFGNWSITAAGKRNRPAGAYQPQHVSVTRRLRRPYTIRLWSVRHSRFLERVYALFADLFLKLHPFWNFVGYCARRGAGEIRRAAREGLSLRLPHVRAVHPLLDRHVMPDELPEAAAQRSLRRRARQRQLRGRAGHALRLGAGLGGQPPHAGRRRDPARCRSRSTIRCARPRPGCA